MNRAERAVDRALPELAVYLRLAKKRMRGDFTLRAIEALVRPGEVVVDVGAYRGVYTLKLARQVDPGGWVWAVEPMPDSLRALRRRWDPKFGRSPAKRVGILPFAASDHSGSAELRVPVVNGHAVPARSSLSKLEVACRVVPIELRPLDDMVTPMNSSITFMKIDAEGHEHEVLSGASRILRYDRPNIFVEIEQRHRDSPVHDTFDLLRDAGYEGYFVLDDRLHPLSGFDLDIHQPAHLRAPGRWEGDMPPGYVHDFLFVRAWSDRSIISLVDRAAPGHGPAEDRGR